MAFCGRPTSLSAPAKPNPCSNPNVNATTHGQRAVRPGLPACAVNDFRRNENDGQRDHGFDRRTRHADQSQRRRGERDAVRDGEGRNRRHHAPGAFDDQQQRQHEQQVIDPEQDVLHAEHEIGPRNFPCPGGSLDDERRI